MENATQALFMAASVLLLIVALTISISSFATLKVQVEDIVDARDEVLLTKDESGGYLNYIKNDDNDVRTVGVETIISAFRRLRKEQYIIYIKAKNENLSQIKEKYADLIITTSEAQKYNNSEIIEKNTEIIKLSASGAQNRYLDDDNVINSLYEILNGNTYKEYIGIYQNKADSVSEANKVTYKIITFVQQIY